jgi:hypothetical protein
MNALPSLINMRSHLAETFSTLQRQAARESLVAKLIRKNTKLAIFPEQAPEKSPNRRFSGTEEILIERIIGTLNRHHDFDHKFRPLKPSLRDRWVNAYLAFENNIWSPILVHKVGEHYYVEDGHHRVSVARALGMTFIQARVWEYPTTVKRTRSLQPEALPCPDGDCVEVYAIP